MAQFDDHGTLTGLTPLPCSERKNRCLHGNSAEVIPSPCPPGADRRSFAMRNDGQTRQGLPGLRDRTIELRTFVGGWDAGCGMDGVVGGGACWTLRATLRVSCGTGQRTGVGGKADVAVVYDLSAPLEGVRFVHFCRFGARMAVKGAGTTGGWRKETGFRVQEGNSPRRNRMMQVLSGPVGAKSCSQERKLLVSWDESLESPRGATSFVVVSRCRPAGASDPWRTTTRSGVRRGSSRTAAARPWRL